MSSVRDTGPGERALRRGSQLRLRSAFRGESIGTYILVIFGTGSVRRLS